MIRHAISPLVDLAVSTHWQQEYWTATYRLAIRIFLKCGFLPKALALLTAVMAEGCSQFGGRLEAVVVELAFRCWLWYGWLPSGLVELKVDNLEAELEDGGRNGDDRVEAVNAARAEL